MSTRQSISHVRDKPQVLIVCLLIIMSSSLTPPLIRMFGPDLWQGFGLAQQGWSLLKALQGFVLVLFVLSSGVLGDLYGRKRVLTAILAVHILFLAVGPITTDRWSLASLLTGLAVTSAMMHPLVIAFIVVSYEGRARITALTVFAGVSAISILLIPVIDNLLLNSDFSWLMFVLPLVAAIAGIVLLRRYIPARANTARPRPINVVVVAIWAAAVCAVAYGLLLLVGLGFSSVIAWLYLAGGVVGLVAIRHYEQHPLVEEWRYELHRERPLTIAIVSGVILALSLQTITGQLYYFFKDIQDAGPVAAGFRLVPVLLGAILLGALAARITDRRGDRVALALGLAVSGLSAICLSILEPDIRYLIIAPLMMLAGFGYVLGNSPRVLLLSRSVPSQLETTVQAIGVATAQVGGAMAYTMTLGLITFFTGNIYSGILTTAGISQEIIDQQLVLVEVVTNATRGTIPPEQQAATIAAIIPAYELAHTEAVGRMLLVLGLVCFVAALIVYWGVREEEIDAAPIVLPPDDSVEEIPSTPPLT